MRLIKPFSLGNLACAIAAWQLATSLIAQTVSFTEYPVPIPFSQPNEITVGPDGELWFTELGGNVLAGNHVGRVTTAGAITEFDVPYANFSLVGITAGPDGALWFAEGIGNIGRITTTGVVTLFPLPAIQSTPAGITAGPDGALWFTEAGGSRIGRITTSGVITEFPVPTTGIHPVGITAGPDGALWFTESGFSTGDKIGRITTTGAITEFPLSASFTGVNGITAGPDGALWFPEGLAKKIGRITTAGIITEFALPKDVQAGGGATITAGPDGALWFTAGGDIGRITAEGVITEFRVPADLAARSIATGRDGALWFTGGNAIGRAVQVPSSPAMQFVPVTPCRVADTRLANGPLGGPAIAGGTFRDFAIPNGACGIPFTAAAYSMNVTAIPHGTLGFLALWPSGQARPLVATLNSIDGRVKSNAAIVAAGLNGAVSVYAKDATDVVLDINGYFVGGFNPNALAFYPLTPCRIADTRNAAGRLGGPSLAAQSTRAFPILASSCGLPANAQVYSLNFAVVPKSPSLGALTVWPAGQPQPFLPTLIDPTGTVAANAAIVPAGTNGDVSVFTTDATDLVIDINGYFAPQGTGGLSLYTVTPCRVLDSRLPGFFAPLFTATQDVNVTAAPCSVPATVRAFVLNPTVVPLGFLGFITLWPQGNRNPWLRR